MHIAYVNTRAGRTGGGYVDGPIDPSCPKNCPAAQDIIQYYSKATIQSVLKMMKTPPLKCNLGNFDIQKLFYYRHIFGYQN